MAMPPTTPPAIAPAGGARVVGTDRVDVTVTGGLDDVEVEEDGTLLEVSTIELDSPTVK
jgi:hypothetical protein